MNYIWLFFFILNLIYIFYLAYNAVFHTKKTLDKIDSKASKHSFKNPMSRKSQEFWAKFGGIGAMIGIVLFLVVLILYLFDVVI